MSNIKSQIKVNEINSIIDDRFTKLDSNSLYELWDTKNNEESTILWFIDKNAVIKSIKCHSHISNTFIVFKGNKLIGYEGCKPIKSDVKFDKFVEKYIDTIFFRTEEEAQLYLKSIASNI